MGFFDSKSVSTSQNTTQNQTTSIGASDDSLALNNSTFTVTDGGAIEKFFQLTQMALENQDRASRNAIDQTVKVAQSAKAPDQEIIKKYGLGALIMVGVVLSIFVLRVS